MSGLLGDALGYRDQGISCIPVGASKNPLVKWSIFTERHPTDAELRHWFDGPKARAKGVAVISGPVSDGLAIRDFDNQSEYDRWAERNPVLARELPTSRGKRGPHVWHRSDLDRVVKLAGGEYRGAGITIAPHSLHPSGCHYQWLIPLPKGRLPLVEHTVFTGTLVTEKDRMPSLCSLSVSVPLCNVPVDEIITKTLPRVPGERNNALMNLARGLKFNAGMSNATMAELKPIVHRWFMAALPYIDTKDFEITLVDFEHAFSRAKHPLGLDVVDQAADQIDPHDLCAAALQYEGQAMRRLVSLCFELSKLTGGVFFLSCHDAGKRLGIRHVTAWRLLRLLEQDGVIECVERGYAAGVSGKATRYRWIGGNHDQEIT